MSLFQGADFFCILIVLLIPALVLGVREKNRKWYILITSIIIDALAIGRDLRMWIFFLIFLAWESLLVRRYLKVRSERGRDAKWYRIYLCAAIIPLVLGKISEVVPMSVFQILGISYLTFKACQVIIETYDGIIKEISVSDFLTFLLFFPAISSGPIDRSRRFDEDLHERIDKNRYLELVGDGLWKLLLGVAYKFAFAAAAYHALTYFEESYTFTAQLAYAYSYGIYMFFDFAGYSLMAVGVSYMLGIRIPDNFNKPFLAVDMLDFWNRWHMTLSFWFKDFIFTRFVMKALKGKWFKSKLQAASYGFLVDMMVMGVWHGLKSYYVLYGLYHGLLLMLTEVWQKKSKFHKKHKKERWYKVVSWAITMQLVMFGFLLFSGHLTAGFGISF